MKNINRTIGALLLGLLALGFLVGSCDKEEVNTAVELHSFGPSPALRGGDLRFIGENLDKVTAIILTDNVTVNTFKTRTEELLVITVPEETVDGYVTLKTPDGDIRTKTILTISEPIEFTSFSPAEARPGDVVTINGDYLNLIREVIFSNKKAVGDTAFVSQSKEKIEVAVPEDAQTGLITISNGLEDPILVESETELTVTLPAATGFSPNPVKAGTTLTINGTNMDLAREVVFSGGSKVNIFGAQELGKIELTVPADAKDGPVKLVAASLVEVTSSEGLVMVVPNIGGISPNPAKPGGSVTVTGTNMDLVTKVTFGGGKTGNITGGTATQLEVDVPLDATAGALTFTTAADKTVTSPSSLGMIKPTITGISPLDVQVNNEITISGNDLDIAASVKFSGGTEADVSSAGLTEATVTVPVGTQSGPITVVSTNGDETTSSQALNILPSTSVVITSMPTQAKPGDLISIEGENLNEVIEIIFPGNVFATQYGVKTDVLIEVYIPTNVQTGFGTLTLITGLGDQIQSPVINIVGVDPVEDPSLVFFNFDGLNSWWGDVGGPENDPQYSLDGSSYHRVNTVCDGWKGFFWRNGQNGFPAATIGTNVASYVLKFDIWVIDPITGGEFAWRFKGSSGDFWYRWKPWEGSGSYETPGWITVTVPLTDFLDGANQIQDMNTITEDFGVAFNAGTSMVNVCIDNVRFELD